jgi:phosphopantothenoylcysteine decarboxylase/phosphopantothenate--cysteine ligase
MENCDRADIVVMAAAVSDYRPEEKLQHKVKKGAKSLQVKMMPNPDILKKLGASRKKKSGRPLLVGFAAESKDHLEEGKRKLKEKNLDLVVVNDILGSETGFGSDTNQVFLVDREYQVENLPLLTKEICADMIWDKIVRLLQ